MATAINTNVGQRESLLTPQATSFSTVQAARTPVPTGGKELADALGVLQPAFGALAQGAMKNKDMKDVEAAAAEYNNLTDVDKALVIGHPAYADKSWPFRNKLRELQTDRSNRMDNQTMEEEIRAGKLTDPQSIEARSQELRAASLGDTQDMDTITQYDKANQTALTKYGMVGAVIKGQRDLNEARTLSQESVNAAFASGGFTAAKDAFTKSMKAANWTNTDSSVSMMEALKSSVFAKGAGVVKSLESIDQMRKQEVTDATGKVIGIFGDISGHGDKLQAMETQVMTRGTKESTLEMEHLTIAVTKVANTGDVEGTMTLATHLTNHQNPVVAEWAKSKVADFVLKAEAVKAANTAHDNTLQLEAETSQASKEVAFGDLEQLSSDRPMGSTLEQSATKLVTVMGRGGKPMVKEITISAEERKRNLRQLSIEKSDEEHRANPNETAADWFLRDYKRWSKHGMVPPHHAAMAKQGISAMRTVGDNTDKVSADAVQTLRQFQLLQNNPAAAKELFGPDYDYLYEVDQQERVDGKGTKEAARLINQVDKKYAEVPDFKKAVDAAASQAMGASTSWFFGDTVKNGAELSGDVKRFAMIAMSDGKTPEAAIAYAQKRIGDMPVLHGSKVRPFVAQALVVDANTTPDDLLQGYLKDNILDKGRVPQDLMSDARLSPVEENGKVVGFKFKMNQANTGYWMLFGGGKEVAPLGFVKDVSGADVYLSVDQINKYGADERTSYGKLRTARRSTNRVPVTHTSNPFVYR